MNAARLVVNRLLLLLAGGAAVSAGALLLWAGPSVRKALPWSPPTEPAALWRAYGQPTGAALLLPLAALLALSLLWGVGQLPDGRRSRLIAAVPGLRVRRRALARAIARDIRALPGVDAAGVGLRGHAGDLRATVRLRLTGTAPPGEVLRQVVDGPVHRARAALDAELAAEIRVTARRRLTRAGGGGRAAGPPGKGAECK
ncbi:hypothetical protein [Streptomyces sp. NPDC048659]|uniref:hypothetical protein n=1 Tax=Streptomyces sp. NPDC048659 TaxID=3155489 RepID=UPI00341DBADA